MSLRVDLLYNKGTRVIAVAFFTPDGAVFDMTGLEMQARIGSRPVDDPETTALLVIDGEVADPATDGIARFAVTAEDTVALGFGTFYGHLYVLDGDEIVANSPPLTLAILATEGNADA